LSGGIFGGKFSPTHWPGSAAPKIAFNCRSTIFWHDGRMPDEHSFALRQVDQARTDFAIIEDELEAIHAWLARLPTAADLWRATPLKWGCRRQVARRPDRGIGAPALFERLLERVEVIGPRARNAVDRFGPAIASRDPGAASGCPRKVEMSPRVQS
jgi:glutathione S-transferase